jgi:hypothetical protein
MKFSFQGTKVRKFSIFLDIWQQLTGRNKESYWGAFATQTQYIKIKTLDNQ